MFDELKTKILVLSSRAWEDRVRWPKVVAWLENFTGQVGTQEKEQLHALYLLAQFMYFGSREMRELLRALFRDLFQYPLLEQIRRRNDDTTDLGFIAQQFAEELAQTRFLGVGNPSESGVHLLYYFRQENELSKDLFLETHRIFSHVRKSGQPIQTVLSDQAIRRYIFVDDLCGSGNQAAEYSNDIVQDILNLKPDAVVAYYALFATQVGLEYVRANTLFGKNCGSVFQLDATYRCVSSESRFFANCPAGIDLGFAGALAKHYGEVLWLAHPLGFNDNQLLLGFHHNTPDNTIPLIWASESVGAVWTPIFKRYPKVYGGIS